ncbi:MAG: acyl-CoA dehydrogenase family protein [Myxococcota bacterium]
MTSHAAPILLLNDEQHMLAKTACEFVAQHAPAARLRTFRDSDDGVGFSRDLWRQMAELGWLGLQVPTEYGGLGLGFFDLCVVLEATGRELMPEPFVSTSLLGVQSLLLGGSDVQKQAWLPRVASGESLLAVVHDERHKSGRGAAPSIRARTVSGGFELSGAAAQVLDAHVADQLLVSATAEDDAVSLFLVDPGAEGVTITRQSRIDGHGAAIVRLESCHVPTDSCVGAVGEGASLLAVVLDRAAIGLSAQMLGAAEQAFADTLAYLKERQQFDAPIGSFQALQHRAVDLYTELALLRSAVLAAARAVDEQPDEVERLATLANALASETLLHVSKEAIQMHGGIGVTDEHDIGLYLKRAQATYMSFGVPSQQRDRWAELHGY